jgi:hypothetical protein
MNQSERPECPKAKALKLMTDALAALTGNRLRDNLTRLQRRAMVVVP